MRKTSNQKCIVGHIPTCLFKAKICSAGCRKTKMSVIWLIFTHFLKRRWVDIMERVSKGHLKVEETVAINVTIYIFKQKHASKTQTGFNGSETNCRIAHNLGILLMNSNCFVIFFFSRILVMSVQISIRLW